MERIETNVQTGERTVIQLTAEEVEAAQSKAAVEFAAALPGRIKAECRRRIYAVIDETAQVNLAAERAAGTLDPADVPTYQHGLEWIRDMRAKCRALIEAGDSTFVEDRHWPVPDPFIVVLARKF